MIHILLNIGVVTTSMVHVKQRLPDGGTGESKNSKFAELTGPDQCRSIRLMDPWPTGKVSYHLIYSIYTT